ncbi:RICIN domain-containing protein [Actinomadura decatromicini]|uniref:RICIN domain-containing protein n=1 Tax=Actinomadura decatromicini TaxID=2604572 RepID=UPI0016531C3E|nr:ricin-type beta-trefoil lectin domain protein [Actinomadura decatromicini]
MAGRLTTPRTSPDRIGEQDAQIRDAGADADNHHARRDGRRDVRLSGPGPGLGPGVGPGLSPGDGAATNTYDCHPGNPQLWRFSGDTLISGLNGKCLSVLANNFAAGAAVVNFGCNGGRGQSWRTTT